MNDPIVCTVRVSVNRLRSPQEAIDATGRVQYGVHHLIAAIPKGEGDEVEIVFFRPRLLTRKFCLPHSELQQQLEVHGLKPADPMSVAAVNAIDPHLADDVPHYTYWEDDNGRYEISFHIWSGERRVHIGPRHGSVWYNDAPCFATVRK